MRPGEEAHWIAIVFVRCAGDDIPQVRRKDSVGKLSRKHLTARFAEIKNRRQGCHSNSPGSVLLYAPTTLTSLYEAVNVTIQFYCCIMRAVYQAVNIGYFLIPESEMLCYQMRVESLKCAGL